MAVFDRLASLFFGQKPPADMVVAHSERTRHLDQPQIASKGAQGGWPLTRQESISRPELTALETKISTTSDPSAHFESTNDIPVLGIVQSLQTSRSKVQSRLGIGGHFSSSKEQARLSTAPAREHKELSLDGHNTAFSSASASTKKIARPTRRRSPRVPRPKVLFSGEVLQPWKPTRKAKPIDRSYKDASGFIGSPASSPPLSKPRKRPVDPTYRPTTERMSPSSSTSSVMKIVKKRRTPKRDQNLFQLLRENGGLAAQQMRRRQNPAQVSCSNEMPTKTPKSSMQLGATLRHRDAKISKTGLVPSAIMASMRTRRLKGLPNPDSMDQAQCTSHNAVYHTTETCRITRESIIRTRISDTTDFDECRAFSDSKFPSTEFTNDAECGERP